jgi:hypothetical protein
MTKKIIEEMRKFVDDRSLNGRTTFLGGVVKEWVDALEASMREPVAYMMVNADFPYLTPSLNFTIQSNWHPSWKPIPLYAFPSDAAGEIERLKADMDAGAKDYCAIMERYDAQHVEIERLRESVAWHERRWAELQRQQAQMRDPERKMVCDILANGKTYERAELAKEDV